MFTKKCEAPGCGALISFVGMRMGGNMPVDAIPIKMVIRPVDLPEGMAAKFLADEKYGELVDVFRPHWYTCKDPEAIKRRGRAVHIQEKIESESLGSK